MALVLGLSAWTAIQQEDFVLLYAHVGKGGKEVSLWSLLCRADGYSYSEVIMWKAETSWRWGCRTAWWGGEAAWPRLHSCFPRCGVLGLLLLRTTAAQKGLGAHICAPCPQWVLRVWVRGSWASHTQDMIAAGHRFVERLSLGVRKSGWIVERMRTFCLILSILSKLTCHYFSCCLCGLSHHHFSLRNTSVAVSLFSETPERPSVPSRWASFWHWSFPELSWLFLPISGSQMSPFRDRSFLLPASSFLALFLHSCYCVIHFLSVLFTRA